MKKIEVHGLQMAYRETGSGDPIVLLHGNPTSSYLWRKIIPHLEGIGRCIAPDLIGMGGSDPLPDSGPGTYRFSEHARFVEELLARLEVGQNAILVGHDWGGALLFDWACRHVEAVQGIAYMETLVCPVTWKDWPDDARNIFQAMRSDAGEKIILEKNVFIEKILPNSVLRDLSEEEMEIYRYPFPDAGERRRPMLSWPREIPVDGEPAEVVNVVKAYGGWLQESGCPKLFINAEPGSILVGPQREFCRSFPNQREVTVRGLHFIQEDSPDEIGRALNGFIRELRPAV